MLRFIKGRLVNGKQGTSDYTVQSLVDAFQAEFAYFRFSPECLHCGSSSHLSKESGDQMAESHC